MMGYQKKEVNAPLFSTVARQVRYKTDKSDVDDNIQNDNKKKDDNIKKC